MERFTKPLLICAIVAFAALGINNVVTTKNRVELKEVQLKSTTSDLIELQGKYDTLNVDLQNAEGNAEQIKQLQEEKAKLEQEKADLEKQVSLKQEAAKLAASKLNSAASLSAPAYAASGSKESWLLESGIQRGDWGYVDWIVSRESGWQPCAYNPGQNDCSASPTSACGLVQQYPCGKIPGDWRDPVAALKWQASYVCGDKFNAYAGSSCYARAVNYWKQHGNY